MCHVLVTCFSARVLMLLGVQGVMNVIECWLLWSCCVVALHSNALFPSSCVMQLGCGDVFVYIAVNHLGRSQSGLGFGALCLSSIVGIGVLVLVTRSWTVGWDVTTLGNVSLCEVDGCTILCTL